MDIVWDMLSFTRIARNPELFFTPLKYALLPSRPREEKEDVPYNDPIQQSNDRCFSPTPRSENLPNLSRATRQTSKKYQRRKKQKPNKTRNPTVHLEASRTDFNDSPTLMSVSTYWGIIAFLRLEEPLALPVKKSLSGGRGW